MALTADNHVIDQNTGFALDKETGHPIGLVPPPVARVNHDSDWPKWITPHESHIVRKQAEVTPDAISVLGEFTEFHVNRVDGSVTVLVQNEDQEQRATSEYKTTETEVPVDVFDNPVIEDTAVKS